MVAALDLAYSGTDALNDTSAFVAEDYRQGDRIHLVADDNVGVAHSGRDDPHQHLVAPRFLDGESSQSRMARLRYERPRP